MTDTICNICHKNRVLQSQGLCFSCNHSKEKLNYETMVLHKREILYTTVITILIYLLNLIPTILLYTLITNRYFGNTSLILTYGITLSYLLPYSLIKCHFAYKLWHMRYQQIPNKGIHLIPEAISLITKFIIFLICFHHPDLFVRKLSVITKLINNITSEKVNTLYLTLMITATAALFLLRLLLYLTALILNNRRAANYKDFFDKKDILPVIQLIQKLENGYLLSHDFLTITDNEQEAIAKEPRIAPAADEIFQELNTYANDLTLLHSLSEKLTSNDKTIFLTQEESLIYYAYIKNKLTHWKDENSATEGYLEQELLSETMEQFENIRLLYRQCKIESKTFFELSQRYETELEHPLTELSKSKKLIKQRIDRLYRDCDTLLQKKNDKERLGDILSLFGNKIKHLPQLRLDLNGKVVAFDHVILSKQGIFIIERCCFDIPEETSLLIEKDGSLWIHNVDNTAKPAFFPFDNAFLALHNERILLLEHYLEESMDCEDIPVIGLLVTNQTGLHIENFSQRMFLSMNEIIPTIRSYQKQLSNEFLTSCYSFLIKVQVSDATEPVPNYRELLLHDLEDNLNQKIALYHSTKLLQSQIQKFKNSLSCLKTPSSYETLSLTRIN